MNKSKTLTFTDILDAKFYNKNVIEVNPGGLVFPLSFKNIAQDIIDLPIYDSDVWICSFPKTGTTWAAEMAWLIGNDLNFEGAKQLLNIRVPMVELSSLNEQYVSLNKTNASSVEYVKDMPQPRFVKTHLPWDLLPSDIAENGRIKAKIIYTARDPKDACVSNYHFVHLIEAHNREVLFDEFCEAYLNGKIMHGSIWNHIVEFWKRRDDQNLLFLKYEEMKSDLPGTIRKVARFLNKELTDEQVTLLSEHLSFDKMKNNRAVNFEPMIESIKGKDFSKNLDNKFMRKGTVGDWKNHMSKEITERFNQKTKECLDDLMYE